MKSPNDIFDSAVADKMATYQAEAAAAIPEPEIGTLPEDTKYKAAKFIETYTGRKFFPLYPDKSQFSVIDIAHALSNQCRYTGHVAHFYPVAQHCCILAEYTANVLGGSALDCLQILMHDSPEGYLVDIARPVKQYMPQYREWDHKINAELRSWMGWDGIPIPEFQDDLDSRIIVDERAALMTRSGNDWGHRLEPLGVTIERWTPEYAEERFLQQYAAYSMGVYGKPQYINMAWGKSPYRISDPSHDRDDTAILDIMEVDIRGKVARVKLRDEKGMMVRDRTAPIPRSDWAWYHGDFEVM